MFIIDFYYLHECHKDMCVYMTRIHKPKPHEHVLYFLFTYKFKILSLENFQIRRDYSPVSSVGT